MQETWQKASEQSLPRLPLMLTAPTALPGQRGEAWRTDPTGTA